MGRMYGNGKGISSSAIPWRRAPPTWLKMKTEDVVDHIAKLAKKGPTSTLETSGVLGSFTLETSVILRSDTLPDWYHSEGLFRYSSGKNTLVSSREDVKLHSFRVYFSG
jgi:hypothetical protein